MHFFIYFLLAILLFIGWQEQVCLLINKYLLPVTDIQSDNVWDGAFLLGSILIGYGCRRMLNLKRVMQPLKCESIAFLVFVLFVYLYYRFDESVYSFTRFSGVEWVAYLDIPMVFCLALVMVGICKLLFPKGTKSTSPTVWLSSDAPKKKLEQDVFAMSGQVTQMVSYLKMVDVSERAFSIGVVGEWGDGKSTFFNFIKSELEKSDDLIWMDFFPRNSKDVSHIQEDFLNTLKKTLLPYYPHLSEEFSKYADALNVTVDVNPAYAILWCLFKRADVDIYYDPIIAASTIGEGQPSPIYRTDESYYMNHFKKCFYDEKTYDEIVREKHFQFVHEVQHWLRSIHCDELKIKKSFLYPNRVSPQATVHKYS